MSSPLIVSRGAILEVDAADITTSFTLIGVLPAFTRIIKIKGNLNGAVYLTYDPSVEQIWMASGMSQVEDHCANTPSNLQTWGEPSGRPYYIKWDGSAPGSPTGKLVIETNVSQAGV